MTPVLLGQLLGVSFACGLNLYITVAALGILSRVGLIDGLPPGLRGLEGLIVIGSALTLYLIEAVIDKVRHADSLWDTVHTFIRPPAAALLALGTLWPEPLAWKVAGALFAFLVALAAHATKAGFRLALNTATRKWRLTGISFTEDIAAVAFAVAALEAPATALLAGGAALLLMALFGHGLFRAFALGIRCLVARLRALLGTSRWREGAELPREVHALLDQPPIGTAGPRGARAGVNGIPGVGAYRSGWLVITRQGPVFFYRTLFGARRVDLPAPVRVAVDHGLWADLVRVDARDSHYTLFLLKDGPAVDLAISALTPVST
ncbi:MAG TPA: DUF4126 domain-containing protein [Longimicrobiales bacterium]|nr:DUF4126 domain-containing protein [Longimicrobiales bacterium]